MLGPTGRPMGIQCGPRCSAVPYVSEDSGRAWSRGMLKRIVAPVHVSQAELSRFYAFVSRKIESYPVLPRIDVNHKNLDIWLAASPRYSKKEGEHFHRVLENYLCGSRRGIMALNSFIKREVLLEIKEPRIINSRSDMFKAVMGYPCMCLERLVYDEHFIKHLSPEQVAARVTELVTGRDFMETDYSTFELSISEHVASVCELALARHCFQNNPELMSLFERAHNQNKLFYKHGLCSATFKGTRMSGDLWTSSMNGFTNAMLMSYMLSRANATGDYIVEGDDGILYSSKPVDTSIAGKLGFKLKQSRARHLNDVSFCGMNFMPSGHLAKDPVRVITKLGVLLDPATFAESKRSLQRRYELLRSKVYSAAYMYSHMPVIGPICRYYEHALSGYRVRRGYLSFWELEHLDFTVKHDYSIDTCDRFYVAEVYGISVKRQLEIEAELDYLSRLPYKPISLDFGFL